jgi:hypothetical protein
LWPFHGYLVYFFPFWFVVPRKIWQPCSPRKVPNLLFLTQDSSLRLASRNEKKRCAIVSKKCIFLDPIIPKKTLCTKAFEFWSVPI